MRAVATAAALVLALVLGGCAPGARSDDQVDTVDELHRLGPDSCEQLGGVWTDATSGCLTPQELETWMTSACGTDGRDFSTCRADGFPPYDPALDAQPDDPAVVGRDFTSGLGAEEQPEPDAECVIKGNVSIETGERIYHVPGQEYYDETVIDEDYGERWFCTEEDAVAAGWRKSRV